MKIKNIKKNLFLLILLINILCLNNIVYAVNTQLTNSINNIIAAHQVTTNQVNVLNSGESQPVNANRFAFILFYLHSCPHCQRFDPILRDFSQNNRIPVLAYTLDGQALPSFPDSVTPTQSEVLKFFPTKNPVVPTLFLMDKKTHLIYPVLQGEATKTQLSQRVDQLTNQIEQNGQNENAQNSVGNTNVNEQDFNYE